MEILNENTNQFFFLFWCFRICQVSNFDSLLQQVELSKKAIRFFVEILILMKYC